MEPRRKTPRLISAAARVIVVAALYLARDVLIPFALAVVISFVLAPLVARLQRAGWSRPLAVVTAVVTRLRAHDQDEAWSLVQQESRTRSLVDLAAGPRLRAARSAAS